MKTVCALLILLASVVALAQPQPKPTLNAHELVALLETNMNQTLALGNLVIAHLQRAQTWAGIDANHPDAVALRVQLEQELTAYLNQLKEGAPLEKALTTDMLRHQCTRQEIDTLKRLTKELLGNKHEVETQLDRYRTTMPTEHEKEPKKENQ